MKAKNFVTILVAAALFAATALSEIGAAANITVNQTADKITITGGKGKKIASDKFALAKDGWYIIKISYAEPNISVCSSPLRHRQ